MTMKRTIAIPVRAKDPMDYGDAPMTGEEIVARAAEEKAWHKLAAETAYKTERAREYPPVGDQLDALWKELNYRRLNGENLTQEADDILGQILAIKNKYPKPEDAKQ